MSDDFEDLGDLGGDLATPDDSTHAGEGNRNDGAAPQETEKADAPQSQPADKPPEKNALFGMWGAKTKGSAPLAPGASAASPSGRPSYTGKRWTPPAKTPSESNVGPAKPYAGKKWAPPATHAAPPAARAGTPLLPPIQRNSSPRPLLNVPPPTAAAATRATPPRTSSRASSRAPSPGTGRGASGPHKIDDLEGELDELRELKRQLQLSQMAASKHDPNVKMAGKEVPRSYDPSTVHVNTRDLKDDIAAEFEAPGDASPEARKKTHKPGKLSVGAYWEQKSVGKEAPKMYAGVSGSDRSGSRNPSPGSDALTGATADVSNRTPVEDYEDAGDLTTPLPNSAAAGGGNANITDIHLDDVAVPTPPMGPPQDRAVYDEATGEVGVVSPAKSDASGGLTTEFRTIVEKLVRQVMPTEIDHIEELIEEYEGRETELLDTLTAMEEELIANGGGVAPDVSMASDPDGVYEDDAQSPEKDVRMGVAVGAAAVGGAAVGATVAGNDVESAPLVSAASSVPQHFKDLAAEDTRSNATSSATEQVSNKRKSGYEAAGGSAMPTAVGVPAEVVATAPPSGDEEANRSVGEEDKRPSRKKMYLMIGGIALMVLVGVGVALGVVFGGKSDDDQQPDESLYETRPPAAPPILGTVPSITKVPTPAPFLPGAAGDFFDPDAPPSACNTPADDPQELGVTTLDGTYPRAAVDGDYAVVASGAGYVAFFERNPNTKVWRRTEVFGTLTNVGEISSVAIAGGVAVVGAPTATTDLSAGRQAPYETGAIFIYERPAGGKWRQLRGAFVPDEYKLADRDDYQKARFGMSVDVDGDLIVAGAPEESGNKGSFTVFHRDGEEDWVQVARIVPDANLCKDPFLGYSVDVYEDTIASSVDCDINVLVYKYKTPDGGATQYLTRDQQLEYISPSWGPVSSISMSGDWLAYSTAYGGLFLFRKEDSPAADGKKFFLTQEMNFDEYANLYEYPLEMDGNMMTLAVRNQVFLYTRQSNDNWQREAVVLEAEGDFQGYVSVSVSLSDGDLMVGEEVEVKAYDFTGCATDDDTCIDISLVFDNYPQDTSWKIEADDGSVVSESPAYPMSLKDTTQEVCLPEGNYAFTIMDVYGDGMCCNWGNGSYKLTSAENFVIAEGGEYGAEETTQFTMPFDSNPGQPTPPTPVTPPTPGTPPPTPKPTPQPVVPVTPPPTPKPTPNPTLPPSPPPTAPPVPPAPSTHKLDVTVVLDQYPVDTTWEIVPAGQTEPFYESIPYVASQALTPDTQSVDLPTGTYDFIIYDVYEDGICCNWGEGSYELAFGNDVVASGGSFGASETKRFSTPDVAGGSPECYDVSVELQLDSYPQDTSWDITQGGAIVAESPAFAPGTTDDKQELCLPAGNDYVFTIYDVYQDGMCCKWGEGSYTVTSNGQVIKQGGEFGASESTTFSLP